MPRPKHPQRYAQFWFTLVDAMGTTDAPIPFDLPDYRTAVDKRNEYYSFIKALFTASRVGSGSTATEIERFNSLYSATNGWEAIIRPLKDDAPASAARQLIFRPKDAREDISSMQAQLTAHLGAAPSTPSAPPDEPPDEPESDAASIVRSLGFGNPARRR